MKRQWTLGALLVLVAMAAYFAGTLRGGSGLALAADKMNHKMDMEKKGSGMQLNTPDINAEQAIKVLHAARDKAEEIHTLMDIAVVDAGGNLKAFLRMDGAWIGSIDISQKKAYTSRAFDIATKDLATHSQSGGQFFGIHASNNGKIMIFAGGIPLKKDGKVGVSCWDSQLKGQAWRKAEVWKTLGEIRGRR